ncbi:hypothetical protein H4582DRAFT_206296 [Lactarius indigo]|nr:hypothetical protein H4582DRAFT_206296 [Lactarius indigo]
MHVGYRWSIYQVALRPSSLLYRWHEDEVPRRSKLSRLRWRRKGSCQRKLPGLIFPRDRGSHAEFPATSSTYAQYSPWTLSASAAHIQSCLQFFARPAPLPDRAPRRYRRRRGVVVSLQILVWFWLLRSVPMPVSTLRDSGVDRALLLVAGMEERLL